MKSLFLKSSNTCTHCLLLLLKNSRCTCVHRVGLRKSWALTLMNFMFLNERIQHFSSSTPRCYFSVIPLSRNRHEIIFTMEDTHKLKLMLNCSKKCLAPSAFPSRSASSVVQVTVLSPSSRYHQEGTMKLSHISLMSSVFWFLTLGSHNSQLYIFGNIESIWWKYFLATNKFSRSS